MQSSGKDYGVQRYNAKRKKSNRLKIVMKFLNHYIHMNFKTEQRNPAE